MVFRRRRGPCAMGLSVHVERTTVKVTVRERQQVQCLAAGASAPCSICRGQYTPHPETEAETAAERLLEEIDANQDGPSCVEIKFTWRCRH